MQDGSERSVVLVPDHEDERRERRKVRLQKLVDPKIHKHRHGEHKVQKRVDRMWRKLDTQSADTSGDQTVVYNDWPGGDDAPTDEHVDDAPPDAATQNSSVLIPAAAIGLVAVVVFSSM
jgi:hypothetical protein